MPELPEVETVRRHLEKELIKPKAAKIKGVKLHYPGIIKGIEASKFIHLVTGQSFSEIGRYGKYLFLCLKAHTIIAHLRMEGKFKIYSKDQPLEKHDHVEITLIGGSRLIFADVRKFATFYLIEKGREMEHPSLKKLGPEANSDEFTAEFLFNKLKEREKTIKECLLDQELVCGIGNIYADEILHSAGIHPQTKGYKLSIQAINKIVEASHKILNLAIMAEGTTFRSFLVGSHTGEFQAYLKVFAKDGELCEVCSSIIQKIKLGGRGTHFCPKCQLYN